MATISSHLLNSVDGTHANGVKVTIYQINSSGEKKIFFETETDERGKNFKRF
jgi:5-hydroxyisourate hydrolase